MVKSVGPKTPNIVTSEQATQVARAAALARDIDHNMLAGLLTSAAKRYALNAQHRFPWADTRDVSQAIGRAARKLLILLKQPLASWALPPEYPDESDELRTRAIVDLGRLVVRADIGSAISSQNVRTARADTPDPDRELIGGDLPTIFRHLYGSPRKGDPAGAKDRFIRSACEVLGLPKPSEAAIKKHRERYNADTRRDRRSPLACKPLAGLARD